MRRFTLSLFIILLLVLVGSTPMLADEPTEEVANEVTEEAPLPVVIGDLVVDPVVEDQLETVLSNFIKLLWNAAYLPFAVPMVAVLVAISKRVFTSVSSPALALFWTVVIWLFFLFATQLGYENQFETAIDSLATLGAALFGITITPIGAGAFYAVASKRKVAIIGYSRPEKALPPATTSKEQVVLSEIPRD